MLDTVLKDRRIQSWVARTWVLIPVTTLMWARAFLYPLIKYLV